MKIKNSPARAVAFAAMLLLIPALLLAAGKKGRQPSSELATKSSPMRASETATDSKIKAHPEFAEAFAKLPLSFEKNLGQADSSVRYVSHGQDYQLFLTPQEAVLSLRRSEPILVSPINRVAYVKALREAQQSAKVSILRFQFEGISRHAEIDGVDPLPGRTNYFVGNDPKEWHTGVPNYGRVEYRGIYPGVDLVFYGNQRRLEYDFVVAPGADPKAIALHVEGARKLRIDSHGNLVLHVPAGDVQLEKPLVYQEVNGERREIAGNYAISGNHKITFAVPEYDVTKELIIDPVLNYSTYVGGSVTGDIAYGIAVDASGNAYIAGQTFNTSFPTTTSPATIEGYNSATTADAGVGANGAVFVSEINPAGTQELYFTYLSGSTPGNGGESASGIAIDPAPSASCPDALSAPGICVYVTGTTFSTNFPTTSTALNAGPLGNNSVGTSFISKLNPAITGTSSLVYSTYLGGTGGDFGEGVAVDAAANAYVVGFTDSGDFVQPTIKNGYQQSLPAGNGSAFLARINTTLSGNASLIYSTYLGGNGANPGVGFPGDQANGVAADALGNAYLTGVTSSTNFPTTASAFRTTLPTGNAIAAGFVSVINTTQNGTNSLFYSTYLGGNTSDQGNAVALGPANVVYVTGETRSATFPIFPSNAYSTTLSTTPSVAFVTLIDTSKNGSNSLKYSTFLGGTIGDVGYGIAADTLGNAYITGSTSSSDFPIVQGAFEPSRLAPAGDAFISKLSPLGNGNSDLIYSSYFGGAGNGSPDQARAIALDSANNVYLTGLTFSSPSSFPLFPVSAFQTTLPSGTTSAAFVAKLTLEPRIAVSAASLSFTSQVVGVKSSAQTVTLTNNTSVTVPITSLSFTQSGSDFATINDNCTGATLAVSGSAGSSCTVGITFTASAPGTETATLNFNDSDSSAPQQVSLSGTAVAAVVTVSFSPTLPVTFTSQVVGTTSSPAQTLTVTNTGNAPLNITAAPSITGTNGTPSSDFAIVSGSGTTCTNGATVQPLSTCLIALTFSPSGTSPNPRTANLSLTDNATGSPQLVGLTGTAVATAPIVTITSPSTPLTFASQVVNTTSAAQVVTVKNTGNASLIFGASAVSISGDFAQTNTCNSTTVIVNATCTISVTFTPTSTTNPRTGTLSLLDNAPGSPQTLALTGTAAAAAAVATPAPTSLTFNGQLLTTTSTAQTVTVTNSGGSPLTFAAQAISTSGDFGQTNTCNGTSVQPNATCTISVTFAPTATTNPRTGSLTITSNAPTQTVTLSGTGQDYTVTATTPAAIAPGSTASIPVAVVGLGGYAGAVSFTCSGSIPGGSCVAPSSVNAAPAPGATATFMVSTAAFVAPPPSRRTPPPMSPRQIVLLLGALLLLFTVPVARQVRTRLSLVGATMLLIVLAGCSGTPATSTTSTPAGPYTFSISASSGGVSHAVNVVVTVN